MQEKKNQKSVEKEKVIEIQYKCPKNSKAQFCCSQPRCNRIAIKCITSHACTECKQNHKKCPRQIRINQVVEIAKQKANRCPVQQMNFQDLIKKLINQLTAIRQNFMKYKSDNIRTWGLTGYLSNLLYQQDFKDKTSKMIAELIDNNPVFADKRFYFPPQFKKDIQSVSKVNEKLEKRIFKYFQCYKLLAECDCQFKAVQSIDIRKGDNQRIQFIKLSISKLVEQHRKLKKAIFDRLSLERNFADVEQITQQDQKKDFRSIGKRLFHLTFIAIKLLYQKKDYSQVLKFIDLIEDLFAENRQEFRLIADKQIDGELLQVRKFKAYCHYYLQTDNQLAFKYFSSLPENQLDVQKLKILIVLCERLKLQLDTYLKYLVMLSKKQPQNTELILKILNCYKQLNDKQKILQYSKLLNSLLKPDLQRMSQQELNEYYARQLWILDYLHDKQKYLQQSIFLKNLLQSLRRVSSKIPSLFELQLKFRYRLLVILRYQTKNQFVACAQNSVNVCEIYLKEKSKDLRIQQQTAFQKLAIKIKQYMIKFLIIHTQGLIIAQDRYRIIKKCVNLCEEIRFKVLEPYYIMAIISYELKEKDALDWQNRSNEIYPTQKCYSNKAYLLYSQAMKESTNRVKLNQCLQAIKRALVLNPVNYSIYLLKGLANQNLKQYSQSNKDFQIALKTNQNQDFINKKMALNYQLIVKNQQPAEAQRRVLLQKAQKLYKQCLQSRPMDYQCILGCARVTKLLKKFDKSEQYLKTIVESEDLKGDYQKSQAFMIMGNIREQQAKQDVEKDYDKLDQALKFYLKAGKLKQNKQNVVRIYYELDNQRKAKITEQQVDWTL